MINFIVKRTPIRFGAVRYAISKRYSSSDSGDVFKLQERGFFCDNLAEVE